MNYKYLENRIENYRLVGDKYSALILETYLEKVKYDNDFVSLMYEFIDKAHVLEVDSEFIYQLEKNIKLNKISLKQYVLVSDVCTYLKNNNIHDYNIDELRGYITKYEEANNTNCSNIYLALDLYEMLENMESIIDKKIDLEINNLRKLISNIDEIKNSNENTCEQLYNKFKTHIENEYLNTNKIDNETCECFVQMINDLVAYYTFGYPNISNN